MPLQKRDKICMMSTAMNVILSADSIQIQSFMIINRVLRSGNESKNCPAATPRKYDGRAKFSAETINYKITM